MKKRDVRLVKKKILKCLTEDFTYGRTKTGKPLKRPKKNYALFDKVKGYAVYDSTDLEMIMEAVVRGIYFAYEELREEE